MKPSKTSPIKPAISVNILDRVDIRVGLIELAEDVPGSRPQAS